MRQKDPTKRKTACKRIFRPLDIYAKPVQLTYKGDTVFKTTLGGILSILVMILVVSMGIYKLRDMLLRNLSAVKKNSLVNISNSYTPPEDISAKNISFAFMMSDFYAENSFNDPYYGSLALR